MTELTTVQAAGYHTAKLNASATRNTHHEPARPERFRNGPCGGA
jgi:hypothetical protein